MSGEERALARAHLGGSGLLPATEIEGILYTLDETPKATERAELLWGLLASAAVRASAGGVEGAAGPGPSSAGAFVFGARRP